MRGAELPAVSCIAWLGVDVAAGTASNGGTERGRGMERMKAEIRKKGEQRRAAQSEEKAGEAVEKSRASVPTAKRK